MAYLLSYANGNWCSDSTWRPVWESIAVTTAEAEFQVQASNIVWGPIYTVTAPLTVDAVAMLCRIVNSSGTATVVLSRDGGSTIAARCNFSYQHLYTGPELGWRIFNFNTNIAYGSGTEQWRLGVMGSTNANIAFGYCVGSPYTYNWAQMFRLVSLTPTQLTGQYYYLIGESKSSTTIGTGLSVQRIVTLDETLSTREYAGLYIGKGGMLQGNNQANTNFYLTFQPGCSNIVDQGGIISLFTASTPLTYSSSLTFQGDGTWRFKPGHTVTAYGWVPQPCYAALAQTANTGDTQLVLNQPVTWLNGSDLALTATQIVTASYERLSLAATATSSYTITVSSGLAELHHGTTPIQAHVAVLSRNIKWRGSTSSGGLQLLISGMPTIEAVSRFYASGVQFGPYLGPTTGIVVTTSSGLRADFRACSLIDGTSGAHGLSVGHDGSAYYTSGMAGLQPVGGVTLQTLVSCNIPRQHITLGMDLSSPVRNVWYQESIAIYNADPSQPLCYVNIASYSRCQRNILAGSYGPGMVLVMRPSLSATGSSLSSHLIYGCTSWGLLLTGPQLQVSATSLLTQLDVTGLTIWGSAGLRWSYPLASGLTISQWSLFGNHKGYGANFHWAGLTASLTFSSSCTFDGGPSPLATPATYLIMAWPEAGGDLAFHGCSLEPWRAVTRSVFSLLPQGSPFRQVRFVNCLATSPWMERTEQGRLARITGRQFGQWLAVETATVQKRLDRFGTISLDTGRRYGTDLASERMEPISPIGLLESSPKRLALSGGLAVMAEVYVRTSTSADDGEGYTGGLPRLALKRMPGQPPFYYETVLATAASLPGQWVRLVGSFNVSQEGTYTLVIQCTGSSSLSGWLNVGGWKVRAD